MSLFKFNIFSEFRLFDRLPLTAILMIIGGGILARICFGEVAVNGRILSSDEMKYVSGGGICQSCETVATANCPLASYVCDILMNQNSMSCSILGAETICENDTTYKQCDGPSFDYCDGNASGATPCGHKIRHKCKWTGSRCIDVNDAFDPPRDCHKSDCN